MFNKDKKDIVMYLTAKLILAEKLDDSYKITKECEIEEMKNFQKSIEFLHDLSPESFDEDVYERFLKGELNV